MNNRPTLLAIASGTLLLSNIAIADSVNDWGNWENLATAAGLPAINLPLNFNFPNSQQLTDGERFETVISAPQEGGEKIYAVFTTYDRQEENRYWWYETSPLSHVSLTADENNASFSATDENNQTVLSLAVVPHNYSDSWEGTEYNSYYSWQEQDNIRTGHGIWLSEDSNHFGGSAQLWTNIKEGNYWYGDSSTYSRFIGGTTTSLDQLQKLSSVTKAVYNGHFSGTHKNVNITVNFSNSSWNGTFDTKNWSNTALNSAGVLTVANGNINGANLSAGLANITSDSSTLSKASVDASFFGKNGSNIAGIVDVTSENGRFADVFDTATEGGATLDGMM